MAQKKQVLVVEDNEFNRSLLCNILLEEYEVLEAENGQEALEVLAKYHETIAVILLDVVMPVMDGYTLLRKLKADDQLAVIPVIIITQGNTEEDEISALANGATDYLSKPYRSQIILHRVARLIKFRETSAMANIFKYDRLTGFYTKEYFYQKVRNHLEENPEAAYVILCSNVENFKLYNDTFGREAGDRLLVEKAEILRRRVGEDIICGRYSADRLLCLVGEEHMQKIRQPLEEAFAGINSERTEHTFVKFGIYKITDRSLTVEQMCDRALLAVDSIKGLYNESIAEFKESMRESILREKELTDAMEESLREEQFSVYYQPKFCLQTDSIIGAEALVRWIHPELGFLPPNKFIPLFEKNGFIHKLDLFVWESVCKKIREWKERGLCFVPVSVNVSRADIYQEQLVDMFDLLIQKYEIDPKDLHLEITESAYTESPECIINTVEELRKHGFIVEMDDFGSGYSSLNMLSQMSIDILKLDMTFIRSEMAKPIERRLLNDVVNMAHRMRLRVVAEGVENELQKDRLKDMGCDYAQGYFYAKPMPAKEYEELLLKSEKERDGEDASGAGHHDLYRSGISDGSPELLEKMSEIAEMLPGGFFVYKADETGELLSTNRELLWIFGCQTEEELRSLCHNSFHGMVHPEDLELVESNISSQIEKANDMDYVEYRIVRKDGTVRSVRDYGRFVHTETYGDVYFVLIYDISAL